MAHIFYKPVTVQVISTDEHGEMWQRLVRIKGFTMHEDAEWTADQVKAEIDKLVAPKSYAYEGINSLTRARENPRSVHEERNPVIMSLYWPEWPRSFGVTLDLEEVESSVPVVMISDGPV
jgi:hypothetical protein